MIDDFMIDALVYLVSILYAVLVVIPYIWKEMRGGCENKKHLWTVWSEPYEHNSFTYQKRTCNLCRKIDRVML